ncbi:hypothetical protein KP509_03G050100 [Ceratopteris richardii]|uniref:Tetratricopeptide repeat protein n=1 Tax=Ceratopteris richardii TaxID=49495 RepID=A0A8T2UZV5_CERRI|nr:hypothetical protein KP509_03G050100 [Ceratopteris richardii]
MAALTVGWHRAVKITNGLAVCANLRNITDESNSVLVPARTTGVGLQRRALIATFGAAIAAPQLAAKASVSKRVKLKDVENPKMQEALRAAVSGDLNTAERLFSELIQEEPQSASAWSNRGSVRMSLSLFEDAREDFTQAIQLAPAAPVPYLNRAIAFEALGRFEEAINDCKSAIERDPEEYAAWFNLGNVNSRVKNYEEALTAFEKASLLAPGIAGYRLKEALVLFQLERLDEAKKLLQGLVRKYPNYAEAHAALAAVLWSEGERSRAEEQFTEATKREPLYNNLSWVRRQLLWPPNVVKAMENFLSIA